MGGMNHQPCGKYLRNSTRVSRFLSVAYAELELANVALEDVILTELEGGRSSTTEIENRLTQSSMALDGALTAIGSLRTQMLQAGYADLPTMRTLDLEEIGKRFSAAGMVNHDSWRAIEKTMRSGGFAEVLDGFESEIQAIKLSTQELADSIIRLRPAAAEGRVMEILERNGEENIKREFARAYTCWTTFNALFLASSMLSTEAWYVFMGFGSLTGAGSADVAAA